MAQLVERLPNKCKVLRTNPSSTKKKKKEMNLASRGDGRDNLPAATAAKGFLTEELAWPFASN
jgi:hypothetical protein